MIMEIGMELRGNGDGSVMPEIIQHRRRQSVCQVVCGSEESESYSTVHTVDRRVIE